MDERVCLGCGESCADGAAKACPSCGQPLMKSGSLDRTAIGRVELAAAAPPPEVAEAAKDPQNRFDQYVIVDELGQGGAASVHRAWDLDQGRYVALKVLKTAYKEQAARSVREAHVATQLSHPNIVKVHKSGSFSGWRFIAMELIPGETLDRVARPPLRETMALFQTVCGAVRHAHAHGIVHRDIKPQNILVDPERHPYVVDFGIARLTEPGWTVTMGDEAIGTPSYMAPEQVAGGPPSTQPAVDVYALGGVLYFLLAGRPPFDAGTAHATMERVERDAPPPPRSIRPEVPVELEIISLKCLEKDPARRYRDVQALMDDVDRWLRGEPILAQPASRMTQLWRKGVRHRAVLVPALLFLVLAGLALAHLRQLQLKMGRQVEAGKMLETARPALEKATALLYNRQSTPEQVTRSAAQGRGFIDQAIASAPDSPLAHFMLGWSWELEGRDDKAEPELRKAVDLDPTFAPARYRLGRLLLQRAFMAALWDNSPRTRDDRREQARRLSGDGAREIREAVARGQGLDDPLQKDVAAAVDAYADGDYDSMLRVSQAAIARFEGSRGVEDFHWLAGLAVPRKDAIASYERAVAIRPHFPQALTSLAIAKYKNGDIAGAAADIDHAIAFAPRLTWALHLRSLLRHRKGDADGALADIEAALAVDPRFAEGHNARGMLRQDRGDVDGARSDYDEAIRLDAGIAASYANRASLRRERGDLDGAIADCDAALRINPSFAEAYSERGITRRAKGEFDAALLDYGRAIEIAPRNPTLYYNRGLLRRHVGQREPAIADFKKALEVAPKSWASRAKVSEALQSMESGR